MNRIYIIPTCHCSFNINILKDAISTFLNKIFHIETSNRDSISSRINLFNSVDPICIGDECNFRFYEQLWTASFIGRVLEYGSLKYSDERLKILIRNNIEIGKIFQIEGGPSTLNLLETQINYFGLVLVVSKLFEGMIFIDPEGNINNKDYYNNFEKRLYSIEDFYNMYYTPLNIE